MPTKEPKDIMVSQMVHGTIQSTIMGMYVGAVTSAPVIPADVDATGAVILYLGTTDDTFENGRFYKFGDGTWSEAPVGATFDLTPGKVVVSDAEGNLITSDLDATALTNLSGITGNVQTQIDSVVSDVSSQGTRLTTAEGEIDTLQGTVSSQETAISTAEGEIDTLQSQMGTANSNISALQNTVAGKQDAITGGATTILTQNLGASKALVSDASGKVAISNVSATELGYVAGVTSSIQTQLDNLSSLISAMGGFAVQSVEELPGTGQPNTIYFVPSDSGAGQNIKDEYMWLNNAWELIGSTQFKLSIVQNASGITINGTALQTATTARAGLMTSTEVQAIDALNTNLGLAEDNIETLQTQMAQKVDVTDVVTTSENGLMIASDKVKLNGIEAGANKYVLPVAGTAIGGVKNGGNVVIDGSGNATVDLSGYATTSALNAKADQSTVTELSNNLSTLDSRVSTLAPTVAVDEDVNPPTITVGINGKTAQANLPSGGNNEWEELDLSNLPTDFSQSDMFAIFFHISLHGTDINPSTVDQASPSIPFYIKAPHLVNQNQTVFVPITTYVGGINTVSSIVIGYIKLLYYLDWWNDTVHSDAKLFTLASQLINPDNCEQYSNINITRSNIQDYVYKMYRKRNCFDF